jgi:WD repeat-containing protein 61
MKVQAKKAGTLTGHDGPVYSLSSAQFSNQVYSGGSNRVLAEWNLETFTPNRVVAHATGVIYSSCLIPEFSLLLIGNNMGGIHVIDLVKRAEVRYLLAHKNGVFDMLWNPDAEHIYAAGADGIVTVWNVHDFHCVKAIKLCDQKIRSFSLNQEIGILAIGCGDNFIRLMSTKTLEQLHAWEAHTQSVNVVSFDPTGRYLLSGSKDAFLNCWDVNQDFKVIEKIPAHNFAIYSIAWHPEAELFATGSRDKTVKIWNASDFSFLLRIDRDKFQGHTHSVNTLYWSSFNNYLLSGGDDQTICVWEIEVLQ